MNRRKKNIIMIVILVLLAGGMVFTAYSAGTSLDQMKGDPQKFEKMQGDPGGSNQGQPPALPDGQNKSGDQFGNGEQGSNSDSSDQKGSDSKGSNQGQPPALPDGQNKSGDQFGNGSPDGQKGFDGQKKFNEQKGFDGQKGPGGHPGRPSLSGISAPYYVAFGAQGLAFALVLMYLLMSGMNEKTFRETFFSPGPGPGGKPLELPPGDHGSDFEPTADFPGTETIGDSPSAETADESPRDEVSSNTHRDEITSNPLDIEASADFPETEAMSGPFTDKSISRKKIAAFAIAALLIGGGLTMGQAALATTAFAGQGCPQNQEEMQGNPGGEESGVEASGATTVDGSEETLNDTYTSTKADENAILVTGSGTLTSEGATINKESGDSSNTESSDFSGVNSGLLVQENSTATVKKATIKTSAKGANAVFATGENAKISISDSTITTTGESSSRGLDATYGGTIEADHVTISTQGGSCAAMATDRGEGTVTAVDSTMETQGAGSPVIYSTGDITLKDSKGSAKGAQIAVVEGKNSATIENSDVSCSAAGNRGDVDIAGVMIYQSMSGDADEGTGNFTAKDSTLTIDKDSDYYKTAPMFFVTNTDAVIDLENTDLNYGSDILVSAQGTDEWGNQGSNGGNVTLKAKDQTLVGDIQLDKLSTLTMDLTGSTYKGTINGDQEGTSVSLILDKDSRIKLTGDSYVSSLEDADASYSNIDFNGYKLYVDGKAIN